MMGEVAKKPWMDPDPRPKETYYSYRDCPYLPLYSR